MTTTRSTLQCGTLKITWLTIPVISWSAPNILAYTWNQMQFYNLRIQDEHGGGSAILPRPSPGTLVITSWSWMAVTHDSTLAPLLTGCCSRNDGFIALGRDLGSQGQSVAFSVRNFQPLNHLVQFQLQYYSSDCRMSRCYIHCWPTLLE